MATANNNKRTVVQWQLLNRCLQKTVCKMWHIAVRLTVFALGGRQTTSDDFMSFQERIIKVDAVSAECWCNKKNFLANIYSCKIWRPEYSSTMSLHFDEIDFDSSHQQEVFGFSLVLNHYHSVLWCSQRWDWKWCGLQMDPKDHSSHTSWDYMNN